MFVFWRAVRATSMHEANKLSEKLSHSKLAPVNCFALLRKSGSYVRKRTQRR